jgi:hypothetical protein
LSPRDVEAPRAEIDDLGDQSCEDVCGEQETFLRDHACDEMQGFLFSKPVPPQQLADLLRSAVPVRASPPLQPELRARSEAPARRQRSAH